MTESFVEVTVHHALFRYNDAETGGRRIAWKGEKIKIKKDAAYERAKELGAFTPPPAPAATTPTPGAAEGYDTLSVSKAIEFLEAMSEEERAPYFAIETANKRKGVLTHFDQPTDFE